LRVYKSAATTASTCHHSESPESLAEKWGCSIITGKKASATIAPLSTQEYRTDLLSQRLWQLDCTFFTDTLFNSTKSRSIVGNTCAQIFYVPHGSMLIHPMISKVLDAGNALNRFVSDVGIPNHLTNDGAGEEVGVNSKFD
jgi:hypothetical protein